MSDSNPYSYTKPSVVGHYSLDTSMCYRNDLSQLKYVCFPEAEQVQFDLEAGRSHAVKMIEDRYDVIDNILHWITDSFGQEEWVPPDFVCMRSLLNKFLGTPYREKGGWIMCATRWRGTIYLCEMETDEKRREIEERTVEISKCISWGLKFEQYMCSDEPDGIPDTTPPVNECERQYVVFRAELNNHRLLFGAEIDGVKSKTKIQNCAELASAEFVELKTHKKVKGRGQDRFFRRFNLLTWWGQSHLVGINHLVCGFRNKSGVVDRLQQYKVADFPRMAKGLWDPRVSMSFCSRFLQFVKTLVTEDDPSVVWRFEWKPRQDVTAHQVPGPSFLPEWYISSFPRISTAVC